VRLLLTRPELAQRDCGFCQKYRHDDNGLVFLPSGGLIPRRDKPACRKKGCPKGTPEAQKSLSPANLLCYRHYQRCKITGKWPADPLVIYHARIIAEVEREVWEAKQLAAIRNVGTAPG
jgi:hypothetical protein